MKIETITEDAQEAIISLLNEALLIEHNCLLNYPRMIDTIVHWNNINDEMLVKELNRLGRDSLKHFNEAIKLIEKLGGETTWQAPPIERLADAKQCLEKQLDKEYKAIELYKEALHISMKNKKTVEVREFFDKLIRMERGLAEDVIEADYVIEFFNRQINEEKNHVKIIKDLLPTLTMLLGK
ncbi:ferritin-like domain-containing protein [Chloroflexota bacterium]